MNLVTRIQAALATVLPLIALACLPAATACSAYPHHGPQAVRIDPAFTAEQKQAIYDAVDAWDEAAGLTVAVSSWDDESAIKIIRDDSIAGSRLLGHTHIESAKRENDTITLAGAGEFNDGTPVAAFDFETTAAHELGHLFGLNPDGDRGCDEHGHSNNVSSLMYAHGTPDGVRHQITSEDVSRVEAVVKRMWP
jgi:hypothetical protein